MKMMNANLATQFSNAKTTATALVPACRRIRSPKTVTYAAAGGKTNNKRSPKKRNTDIEVAEDTLTLKGSVGGNGTGSSDLFLNALEKIEQNTPIDAVENESDDDELDFGDFDPTSGRPADEDEFVTELLAAAGLSDEGLPLFFEGAPVATTDAAAEEGLVVEEGADAEASGGGKRSGRRARRADDARRREARIPDELLPRVAIVGRPNVGKSALFNRLVGKQVAIVYDYPGVTRDRLYTRAEWGGREFMMVDTGGLMSKATELPKEQQIAAMRSISAAGLPSAIERQAAAAVEEADALVLVVDGQTGSSASDEEVLIWLRRTHPNKPITLAVNKCENVKKADEQVAEFWETGLEPLAVSAISGSGTGEVLDSIVANLPLPPSADSAVAEDETSISLAIIGRPNVGKSSILNSLVGEERSIVSDMAGTTRDAIDIDIVSPDGQEFKLIDTAGVRRRASVAATKDGAEPLMVERSFRAIRRAEVAVLVIDATEGITQQDFRLAEYIAAEGRACVIAVNKWDLVPDKNNSTLADFEANVRAQLRPIEWANVVFTSAKTGQRVKRILEAATAAAEEHRRRITTATLNLVLQDASAWRAPPSTGSGRRGRVYYGTQAGIKPPTFVLFCNDPLLFADDYKKYMERQFRENVGFPGTPLRLYWRGKGVGGAPTP
jgi:GTP-binding protein